MKVEKEDRENDFAQMVIGAFRKRSKALSRRGSTVECTPVKEIVDGQESKLGRTDVTIAYRIEGARIELRLHVWADRWVWVDARRGSKTGWVWEFTDEGRFVSPGGAQDLVRRAEDTIDASYLSAVDVSPAMSKIWSKHLARGPRPIINS